MGVFPPHPERRPVVVSSYVNHALILGDEERARGEVSVKRLRQDAPQEQVPLAALGAYLAGVLGLDDYAAARLSPRCAA